MLLGHPHDRSFATMPSFPREYGKMLPKLNKSLAERGGLKYGSPAAAKALRKI
jgi:hypothetical protein